MTAKDFEEDLKMVVENNSPLEKWDYDEDIPLQGIKSVKTFEEAGAPTNSKGLVILYEDGSEIDLTIQAFKWR